MALTNEKELFLTFAKLEDRGSLAFEFADKLTLFAGVKTDLTNNLLDFIQTQARKLRGFGYDKVKLCGDCWSKELAFAFYQGFSSPKNDFKLSFSDDFSFKNELDNMIFSATFLKTIINQDASTLSPIVLAKNCSDFIQQCYLKFSEKNEKSVAVNEVISVKTIIGDDLLAQGYNGIYAVGRGSKNPPAFLEIDYNPSQNEAAKVEAVLVGKGITFDTGGLSLKPSSFMEAMRSDMGGSALVTTSLGFAILNGLKARVKLILCCAENMVSADCMRLGDIINYRNGVSTEVLNTDAEGRLVLADGLIDASANSGAIIIDAATLTGAAKIALGGDYHALLSMDDKLVERFMANSENTHEAFWRLPLAEFHRSQIKSNFADIANVGMVDLSAGASTAAAFLTYFVENYASNYLHIDASASFKKSANAMFAHGASGVGFQTIAKFLLNL